MRTHEYTTLEQVKLWEQLKTELVCVILTLFVLFYKCVNWCHFVSKSAQKCHFVYILSHFMSLFVTYCHSIFVIFILYYIHFLLFSSLFFSFLLFFTHFLTLFPQSTLHGGRPATLTIYGDILDQMSVSEFYRMGTPSPPPTAPPTATTLPDSKSRDLADAFLSRIRMTISAYDPNVITCDSDTWLMFNRLADQAVYMLMARLVEAREMMRRFVDMFRRDDGEGGEGRVRGDNIGVWLVWQMLGTTGKGGKSMGR